MCICMYEHRHANQVRLPDPANSASTTEFDSNSDTPGASIFTRIMQSVKGSTTPPGCLPLLRQGSDYMYTCICMYAYMACTYKVLGSDFVKPSKPEASCPTTLTCPTPVRLHRATSEASSLHPPTRTLRLTDSSARP